MIFVSQYLLSLQDCRTLRLRDAYSLHRVVYGLFADAREVKDGPSGILFADQGAFKGMRRILIVSDREPHTPEVGTLERRELNPAFLDFPQYRFECVLNPVRKDKETGRRVPLRSREEVSRWFIKKAPSCGFELDEASLQVIDISVDSFEKAGHRITLSKARITGILTVVSKERFAKSVEHGIGHGKAFGCGLLKIVPLLSDL
ncbi:MAG: type I-E CRISPR-associated protein Cas6/Cse3/CasE [Desulfovibrio sp.]|nr:type I-E CRISPR-associated protein Cas6/Cse3/CasE [Desulfovibrio sp.]